MKVQEIKTLISSLVLCKTKVTKESYLLMVKPYYKANSREEIDALNLAYENKIIKGVRINNDSPEQIEFRNEYQLWLESMYKKGKVEIDNTIPNKPKFILYDNNGDRRSLDINMSNLDAKVRKVKESGLEVSKETSEKLSKP